MPDVLLIQPPIRDFYLTAKRTIPYGLSCIASSLIKEGISVEIFDGLATAKSRIIEMPVEMAFLKNYYEGPDISPFSLFYHFRHFGYSFEHIGNIAKKSNAFLIGISSLFTPYWPEVLKTAEEIKKRVPSCQIVIGGHHPTENSAMVMESEFIDFILRGEGEVSMPLLYRALQGQFQLERVPGIVYRKADGSLQIEPPAIMGRLDAYPPPAEHLIKHKFYQRKGKGSMVVMTSRGCPMKCTYCSIGGSSYLKYRRRDVSCILDEIANGVEQYDLGFVDFEDENLSLNRKWFLSLLQGISERFGEKNLELRAMNGLYTPSLDEEMISEMQRAGFQTLNLSLCTLSKRMLDQYQRKDIRDVFEQVLGYAQKTGMDAVGYIIVGGPNQCAVESVDDLLYLATHNVIAGVSVYYPAPGSIEYDRCGKLGILPKSWTLMRSTAIPVSHTTSRIESLTLLRLGRILNFIKSLDRSPTGKTEIPSNSNQRAFDISDKRDLGISLVKDFLSDGKIRGVYPDGKLFEHKVSKKLTQRFIQGLTKLDVDFK